MVIYVVKIGISIKLCVHFCDNIHEILFANVKTHFLGQINFDKLNNSKKFPLIANFLTSWGRVRWWRAGGW